MVTSKHAAEFVALVTDGQGIDGYGKRCEKCGQPTETSDGRKAKFLKLGRAVLKELAKLLNIDPKRVAVNPAGPAMSGDISVRTESGLQVMFLHRLPRLECGDVLARHNAGDMDGGYIWMRWEELLDLPKVAGKIVALREQHAREAAN
jgi:hypothetical protein